MAEDVFEHVLRAEGRRCGSELKKQLSKADLVLALRPLAVEDYPVAVWNDVLAYFLNTPRRDPFQSIEEVKAFLQENGK